MLKDLWKSAGRGLAFGAAFLLLVAALPGAYAAGVAYFTGPAGTNPIGFPSVLGDLNSLINTFNAAIGNYLTFNNSTAEQGELAFANTSTFAGLGTVSVAAIGSHGVTGTSGNVFEWLTIVDEGGQVGYVPVYR